MQKQKDTNPTLSKPLHIKDSWDHAQMIERKKLYNPAERKPLYDQTGPYFFPQHIVEGLLNSRPREIAIIAGIAFSGPPRATRIEAVILFCTPPSII